MNKKMCSLLTAFVLASSITSQVMAAETDNSVNKGFTLPTKEESMREQSKQNLVKEYFNSKKGTPVKDKGQVNPTGVIVGDDIINSVGTYRQELSYSCGAAASRNLIYGYVRSAGGTCPSEATLRSNLGTTTAGTDFGSKIPATLNQYAPGNNYTLTWGTASGWTNTMASDIEYTINKTGSYDVIGDLYHGASSTPIHSAYQNGAAHYICVYGYNNTSRYFYIADSNSAAPVQYTTPYTNLGNSTQQRGIIW